MKGIVIILLVGLVGACLLVYAAQPGELQPLPSPEANIPTSAIVPTVIASPTLAPTASPTPIPTVTPTPPHPLTIDYLRGRGYHGGEIRVEEVLEPGWNYSRYYVSYQSDGLKIYALMTIPDGDMPGTGWPVVVFNHGYIPPDVYRTTERYIAYVDAFAKQGYIVFRSDYRGHDRSEGAARGTYGRPDYVIDVLNAVEALVIHPQVDASRIGMWGHSMGGYITLRAMVTNDRIKAGVIWAGVVASYEDLLTSWGRRRSPTIATPRPGGWRSALTEAYGSAEENPDFWASLSANNYLVDLSGPLQLHHGTGDATVPLSFSTTLALQIREVGGEVAYYEYPGDNHNISEYFSEAMLRSIRFFNRYVKGED